MGTLWARTVSFTSVNVGDQLPIVVKWETADGIAGFSGMLSPQEAASSASQDGASGWEADADPSAPTGALVAYVVELLEKAFPVTAIMSSGSRLRVEHLAHMEAMDIISLSGQVVDKREEAGRRLVDCRVVVENDKGTIIARASATVAL